MKKVVIISPVHPLRGGIASSSERLAQALQEHGYAVIIYSFSLQYPNFLFPGKTQFSDDSPPLELIIRSRINSVNPINWRSVGREIRELEPDLVIARYWLPFMGPSIGTILKQVRKRDDTKILAITDNVIPHEKRPGDRLFTSYFVKQVDGFVVMSRSVGEDIRQFTKTAPVKYVPHPIYDNYGELMTRAVALQKLGLDPSFRYMLFFGFIRDYKGLDLLLKAMADPRIAKLPIRLIVAGEYYGNQEFYENLIQKEGIAEQLILKTDFIPHDDVGQYFCASDLVVQTYKSATQSGISQLAYHFEKPMVVTAVGGLPEIVEDGVAGYVVPVEVSAIADAIVDFFENDRKTQLERGVRENKKLFSWTNMVEGIEELLGKC